MVIIDIIRSQNLTRKYCFSIKRCYKVKSCLRQCLLTLLAIRNFLLYSKPSAYYTELADSKIGVHTLIQISASSLLNCFKIGLTQIHNLMWGKASSVVITMMTGKHKGGTSRTLLFVTLERSLLEFVPFQWTNCVEMVHIFKGDHTSVFCITGKDFLIALNKYMAL